jgi:glycosyltransferase involved in cell wall biosynthesis
MVLAQFTDRGLTNVTAMLPPIDIVIATTAEAKRASLLMRAIDRIVAQEGVRARPIVVVNGKRFDPDLIARLKMRTDILFIQLEVGDLFVARRTGFEAVTSEFFGIHDDDDFLLPGALSRRLAAISGNDKVDWVVSDGFFVWPDREVPFIPSIDHLRQDPYGMLLDYCWLCSAGNLFRRSAITGDLFDSVPSMEITYIAFRLLSEGRMPAIVEEPTFKYFFYPDSLSKTEQYTMPGAQAVKVMMDLPVPGWVRRKLAQKYRQSQHTLADLHCARGRQREAWAAHLRSLAGLPEFFRYLAFTRRLLAGAKPAGSSARAG